MTTFSRRAVSSALPCLLLLAAAFFGLSVVAEAHHRCGHAGPSVDPCAAPPTASPTASYTYSPTAAKVDQAVSFDASGSSCEATPCSYRWEDGTEAIGTGTTLTYSFSTAGDHQVKLTVTDAQSRSDSVTKTITVSEPASEPAPSSDLALNKPASASSTEQVSYVGVQDANDGDSSTRWSSDFADNQWWQLDLGSVQTVDQVIVNWEAAYGAEYRIEGSTDGSSWTTLWSGGATGSGILQHDFAAADARYVRFYGVTRATRWGFSFWDFEVRNTGSTTGGSTDPTPTPSGTEGDVLTAKPHQSDMDPHLVAAESDPLLQAWWNDHYDRMRVYDWWRMWDNASWLPQSWVYRDAYAIYRQSDGLPPAEHDKWVLRDSSGNRLYIPFQCSGGSCTQFAADIGNPEFRQQWIAGAVKQAETFGGTFMDDVNLAGPGPDGDQMRVSDGNGNLVRPINPRTGQHYTNDEWAADFAGFITDLKAALGAHELVCNIVYFRDGGLSNQYVRQVLETCDITEVERGFNDGGIVAGSGTFGFDTLVKWIDYAHQQGNGVVLDVQTSTGEQYALGTYLLISTGRDYVGGPRMRPDNWWTGWDTNLGAALEKARKLADGTYERRFEGGTVKVDPSARTATISP